MPEENEKDEGAKNGRDYLARIGRDPLAPATFGDVVSVLEYFGVIPQPADHAATPYSRTE